MQDGPAYNQSCKIILLNTEARVDVDVWHTELLPTGWGYCADHIGDDLFTEAHVGPALV